MIDMQSEKRHYDTVYAQYSSGMARCRVSIDNLPKARKRVHQVLETFGITAQLRGAKVLDLGCGLGYFSEALRLEGADVVAVDVSAEAVRLARLSFPKVDFRCMCFPEDFQFDEKFDLIWILDISTMDTFNVTQINSTVIEYAQKALKPSGLLIVGWHSNFSGRKIGNWCHWNLQTLGELRKKFGFSRPRVVQVRFSILSWLTIWVCRTIGKSCPIFLMRRSHSAEPNIRGWRHLLRGRQQKVNLDPQAVERARRLG